MADTILGEVGFRARGEWNPETGYPILSLVAHNGGSYVARQDVPAGVQLTDESYWMPVSDTRETVRELIEQHPEWVTTVEDGSITKTKLTSSLAQQIDATTQQVTVANARIDNIIALPEGSTTGDALLDDIKIGWDGRTYDTPGNAVRGQISQLSESVDHIYTIHTEEHTYLFDDVEWSINQAINASSGAITDYQSYYSSNMIPIQDGAVISYDGLRQPDIYRAILAYYDSDDEFISAVNVQSNTVQSGTVTAPAGSRFVRFCTSKNAAGTVFVSVTTSVTVKEVVTDLLIERITNLENNTAGFLHGKKAVFLGDSITEGMSPEYVSGHTAPAQMHNHGDKIYWEICAEHLTLAEYIGYGVTGTTIKGGTGTSGLPFVDRFDDMDDDADLVCVFGGTNDFGLSSAIGAQSDIPDKTNSFYSALKYLIIGLKKKYPTARIIFCTPLPRFEIGAVDSLSDLSSARREKLMKVSENGKYYYYDTQQASWVEDTAYNTALSDGTATETESDQYDHSYLIGKIKNNRGNTLKEYVDAIKNVCDAYSIPVCDFSATSLLYPYTRKSRYDNCGDGLHPHSNQHKIMGRLLANAIRGKC